MSKKRIVLFSTREIGLPNGLFKKLDSRDWFRSTELCSFFLDSKGYDKTKGNGQILDDNLKSKVLKQFGVDINEKKKQFLTKYGIIEGASAPIFKLKKIVKSLLNGDALKEFEYIWDNGNVLRNSLQEYKYNQDDTSGMAEQKINIDCDILGPYLYYRFSMYKLGDESHDSQDFV